MFTCMPVHIPNLLTSVHCMLSCVACRMATRLLRMLVWSQLQYQSCIPCGFTSAVPCVHTSLHIDQPLHTLTAPWCAAAAYLTSDDVMASKAVTMQSTIEYMNRKYGSAAGYVKAIGLTPSEVSHIRLNMLIKAAPRDLLERLSLSNSDRGRRLVQSKSLHRSTYSGDSMLDGSMNGVKNDRFDSATLSGGGGGSGNRTRHLHRRSLSRRSKTFSAMSKHSKDPSSPLATVSKLPEDLLINRRVTDTG